MTNHDHSSPNDRARSRFLLVITLLIAPMTLVADDEIKFEKGAGAALAAKCGQCHGADRTKRKAELDLRTAESTLMGGESGPSVSPGNAKDSLLWQKIVDGEMPPPGSEPLNDAEKTAIHQWISQGAKFIPNSKSATDASAADKEFWAFRHSQRPESPSIKSAAQSITPIDRFVLSRLEARQLSFAPTAEPRQLVRRIFLDLVGLPPTPAEVTEFLNDPSPKSYETLVDRLLASPQYGERWGRQWLDVAGYADSNGYIRHDSPRPLAWRYRDYVIQSLNDDKPYDQFWIEQLAGDELVNHSTAQELSPADLNRLIATHYLRNAPDGTDNTEGNEITRVMERYAVLESQLQITMSAMFGMTIECARCHSHKFDPIPQRDYYSLQAIFYPAFNVKQWKQPKDRWIHAAGQVDIAAWRARNEQVDHQILALRSEFADWSRTHQPPGIVLFQDDFSTTSLRQSWSDTAPGDESPAGNPAIRLDDSLAPAAQIENGRLSILAAAPGDAVWLSTRQSFDWTPEQKGEWIQVTFDLVGTRGPDGRAAERIGYYLALTDHDDSRNPASGNVARGNLLIDGNPAGGASVVVDYPGLDQQSAGVIGKSGYVAGHRFGVRVTRQDGDQYLLEHLFDGQPELPAQPLKAEQLPDGGFGFELCCSRSFQVDNVSIQRSPHAGETSTEALAWTQFKATTERHQQKLTDAIAACERQRLPEPERIAWATDLSEEPPVVPLLKRGDYFQHGPNVDPGPLSVLIDPDNTMTIEPPASGTKTTGRRLAFARWATRPSSRAAALLARVEVDRIWRGHFGRGLVPTPENFGASGVRPTDPELLEWLAAEFIDNGWSRKALHRQIVLSQTYQQSSVADERAIQLDPDNLAYSRFPAHRLDAESIRDSMLAAAGVMNLKAGGPAVQPMDLGNRQIVLPEPEGPGPHEVDRRSIYIRQRRSEPLTFLKVFDQASPEPNCVGRSTATVVAQSLALLNGTFATRMGRSFAARIMNDAPTSSADHARQAFIIAFAREPDAIELARSLEFLQTQTRLRTNSDPATAAEAALADLCRMLLATNEFMQLQ
ncbi:PSD1 and planctomycete cytochrome C domain-containing protein [Schlesneria paludicola]|uniref:PSD1 and planctomycete cytochrome C domain-containing protein n=1 Tax=Schlesneria paludicola TaxID=360056 RepID=UPI00029A1950|nr:PSD1 and planctomycete cytochrome C domain-containing protein [Schlesneria paludicola]